MPKLILIGFMPFCILHAKNCKEEGISIVRLLKVRKYQKQFMVSSIPQKRTKKSTKQYYDMYTLKDFNIVGAEC